MLPELAPAMGRDIGRRARQENRADRLVFWLFGFALNSPAAVRRPKGASPRVPEISHRKQQCNDGWSSREFQSEWVCSSWRFSGLLQIADIFVSYCIESGLRLSRRTLSERRVPGRGMTLAR